MRTNGTSGGKGKRERQAAYFDLDKTVLATSTTLAMGDPMRRSGLISTTALARGVVAQLPYLLIGADEAQGDVCLSPMQIGQRCFREQVQADIGMFAVEIGQMRHQQQAGDKRWRRDGHAVPYRCLFAGDAL